MARKSSYAQICDVTGKTRYRSEKHARRARRCVPDRVRIYYCEHCRGYHMTNPDKA